MVMQKPLQWKVRINFLPIWRKISQNGWRKTEKKNVLTISFCLSLMDGFDEIMLNEFFPKEKKCQEFSNLNIMIGKHYLI